MAIYKNRSIINQRGGSLVIENSTEREKIKLSQRSGSNINLTNVVNSELATNNKQVNVVHDSFETVKVRIFLICKFIFGYFQSRLQKFLKLL